MQKRRPLIRSADRAFWVVLRRQSLAEVRDAIAAQLRSERENANRQAYLAKLLEQNPPAINELALCKVFAKAR